MKTSSMVILIVVLSIVAAGVLIFGTMLIFRVGFGAGNIKLDSYYEDFGGSGIDSLYVEVSAGHFIITEGDSFRVEAEDIDSENFSCEVRNGTLKVVDRLEDNWRTSILRGWSWGRGRYDYRPSVTIYIPEGFEASDIELIVAAGELSLCDISTGDFDLEMYAGAMTSGSIVAASADIEIAAGNAVLDAVSAQSVKIEAAAGAFTANALNAAELDLKMAAGNMTISDIVSDNVQAQCSAGRMELAFLQSEDYYYISMDIAAGAVSIDGQSYALGSSSAGDRFSSANIELEVAAGHIDMSFE